MTEMTRRGFVEVLGATSMAALGGGGAMQQVSDGEFPPDVEAYGMLIGPEAQRPAPDGPYLSSWDTYSFKYISSDTGAEYKIQHTDSSWSAVPPCIVQKDGSLYFRREA